MSTPEEQAVPYQAPTKDHHTRNFALILLVTFIIAALLYALIAQNGGFDPTTVSPPHPVIEFVFSGTGAENLSVANASYASYDNGTAECATLTVNNTGNHTEKLTGLHYNFTGNFYYGGADPTIGQIFIPAHGNDTFMLWFQTVTTGWINDTITLTVGPVA